MHLPTILTLLSRPLITIGVLVGANLCHGALIMDMVTVGAPRNPATTFAKRDDFSTGYGRVDYVFQMGKYETTNDQYIAFLNAVAKSDPNGLYDSRMNSVILGGIVRSGSNGSYTYSAKPHMGNKPVNYVSWYDAARFANWLHNGQPTGAQDASTTEDGAYAFSGPSSVSDRKPGAQYFLPTEHEWDKAAFYEPGAVTPLGNGWWMYPSHSQVFPTPATVDEFGNVTNPGPHTVNFRLSANWNGTTRGNVVTVGSAGNESFFGARDMSGNVFEWVMADPTKPDPNGWGPYTVRGSSLTNQGHVDVLERNLVHHDNHNIVNADVGFRIAGLASSLFASDFDYDGDVDQDDLATWRSGFGLSGNAFRHQGDANGDLMVDGADFMIWQREFGMQGASGNVPVPEPSAGLLVWLAACATRLFSRRPA